MIWLVDFNEPMLISYLIVKSILLKYYDDYIQTCLNTIESRKEMVEHIIKVIYGNQR